LAKKGKEPMRGRKCRRYCASS
jgi:hypothetical protein